MENKNVLIIANYRSLNNDARERERMRTVEKRAERLSTHFQDLDLGDMQRRVNRNLQKIRLFLDGRYMDIFDLLNFVNNGLESPRLAPDNIESYYSLAANITHNGIYLYQYLKSHGYDPLLVNNYAVCNIQELVRDKPFAVCISSNFIFMDDIFEIAGDIKRCASEVPVVVGGMLIKRLLDAGEGISEHALETFSTLKDKVDVFIVESQGEQTLLKVFKSLANGGGFEKVPNVAYYSDDGRLHFATREKEELPMDQAIIAWDKIPEIYLRKFLPVNSSRGCYYRCRFCTYHRMFPKVEYKSVEALERELDSIQKLGFVEHVRFTDDNFTANNARLESVLEMMARKKYDFHWSCYARANALSPRLVESMKKTGCDFVYMGIESGSQKILDNMDKRLKREESLGAVRLLNDNGIYSRGSFIIGYPGETQETFMETVDLINESGLPHYIPYLFDYLKSTPVHADRDRFGLRGIGRAWKQDTMDSVEASDLIARMIHLIPGSFSDGMTYIEEIYNQFLGNGCSVDSVFELFRHKRDLQLAVEEVGSEKPFHPRIQNILTQIKGLID